MKKHLLAMFVIAAAALAGCSSGSDVRSDAGPSTTAAEGTETTAADDAKETTTTAAVAGPKDSPYLFIQGSVAVPPGDPGKLSVVFTGVPSGDSGSTVPVIVRNNTDKAVENIEVNGTARAADGSLAGSGSSQEFEPAILQPGEWGFGYVYFDSTVPADATIETTARGDNPSSGDPFQTIQLKVNELNLNPGEYGSASYIGIVANTDSDETATDPVGVTIGCFDAESKLLDVFTGYTDGEVVAGGTASFSVEVYDAPACASVAVGSSAFNF
jgi:hypothetical protein